MEEGLKMQPELLKGKKKILEKLADILLEENLLTEVENINLKRKIEKGGDIL